MEDYRSCCLPESFKRETANVIIVVKSTRSFCGVGLFGVSYVNLMQTLIHLEIMVGKALKPRQGYQRAEGGKTTSL